MRRNVLITGGVGFIGSNLAIFLKEKLWDDNIICLDNLIREGSGFNVARLEDAGIQFIKGDIRDRKQLLTLPKIDVILECCAEPSVLAAYDDPQYTIDTNLFGTVNCLELAKRDQSGFVFLSTSRVYPIEPVNRIPFEELPTRFDWRKNSEFPGGSYKGITEDFPLAGVRSLYGATKLCSEQMVIEYLDMFSLKGVINRLGIVAGPWQMGKVDQGIIGFWIARHILGGPLSYIGYNGTGKQLRDALHVDDVCELVLYELEHLDELNGKVFNAGGGRANSFSLLELTEQVSEITGKRMAINSVLEERKADVRIYITDNSRICQETGWTPKKGLDDILIDTYQWLNNSRDILNRVFIKWK